jgi:hypothetical protein
VRKKIGTRQQAIDALGIVKHIRSTGLGVLPSSARQPVMSLTEELAIQKVRASQGAGVTLGILCDGLLQQIKDNPDQYRDQVNPSFRIARIREAFGERIASGIRPHEIKTCCPA